MNVKNNRRAMETRQRIQNTLLEMLEEQELDQISVSQLCKRAEVNRSTFYAHYDDVTDLIAEIEQGIGRDIFDSLPEQTEGALPMWDLRYLQHILERIRTHQLFYRAYLRSSHGQRRMEWGFTQLLEHIMRPYMHELGINDTELEYYFAYFKEGLVAVIRRWVLQGCRESPEYLTRVIATMTEHPRFRWNGQAASVEPSNQPLTGSPR